MIDLVQSPQGIRVDLPEVKGVRMLNRLVVIARVIAACCVVGAIPTGDWQAQPGNSLLVSAALLVIVSVVLAYCRDVLVVTAHREAETHGVGLNSLKAKAAGHD